MQKFYKIFDDANCYMEDYLKKLSKNNSSRLPFAYLLLSDEDIQTISCSDVNIKDENGIFNCGQYSTGVQPNTVTYSEANFILEETLIQKYKELFGQDAIYEISDFYVDNFFMHYLYDTKNKGYVGFGTLGGGACTWRPWYLQRAYMQANKLVLVIGAKSPDNSEIYDDKIIYTFVKEEDTGNYIFESRIEQLYQFAE